MSDSLKVSPLLSPPALPIDESAEMRESKEEAMDPSSTVKMETTHELAKPEGGDAASVATSESGNPLVDYVINSVQDEFLEQGLDMDLLNKLKSLWLTKLEKAEQTAAESRTKSEKAPHGELNKKSRRKPKKTSSSVGGPIKEKPTKNGKRKAKKMKKDTIGDQTKSMSTKFYPADGLVLKPCVIQVPETDISQLRPATSQHATPYALSGETSDNSITTTSTAAINQSSLSPTINEITGSMSIVGGGLVSESCSSVISLNGGEAAAAIFSPASSSTGEGTSQLAQQRLVIPQVDGPVDSSDDEEPAADDDDDDDDDGDDDDDDDNDPDDEEDDEGGEEEPLGTDDDISDEDASDLFDTDNVVVCQYEKITRTRNKWKFYLKDGIMNLNGRDYVFSRAQGEAEW